MQHQHPFARQLPHSIPGVMSWDIASARACAVNHPVLLDSEVPVMGTAAHAMTSLRSGKLVPVLGEFTKSDLNGVNTKITGKEAQKGGKSVQVSRSGDKTVQPLHKVAFKMSAPKEVEYF